MGEKATAVIFSTFLLSLAVFCGVTACSGGKTIQPKEIAKLDKDFAEISLSRIPNVKVPSTRLNVQYKPELVVNKVLDKRSDSVVIRHAGRDVQVSGDVTLGVYYALLKAFRKRGFSVTANAPIQLHTSISHWRATVNDNSIDAEAILIAELFADNDKLHTAIFEGFYSQNSDKILDSEVEQSLTQAMSNALSEMIKNPQLMDFITSF